MAKLLDIEALTVVGHTGYNSADSGGVYRIQQRWQWWCKPDHTVLTVVSYTGYNSTDSSGVNRIQQRWQL